MANQPSKTQPPPLRTQPNAYRLQSDFSNRVVSLPNPAPSRGRPEPQPVVIPPTPPGPPAPDWLAIVWGPINVIQASPTGTFLTNGFTVDASGSGNADENDQANCSGDLTYTGPATNCNVHVVVAATGADIGDSVFEIFITQDLNPVIDYLVGQLPGGGVHPPGTYDASFSIADTGGLPSSIIVEVFWQAGNFMVGPGTLHAVGTITNT